MLRKEDIKKLEKALEHLNKFNEYFQDISDEGMTYLQEESDNTMLKNLDFYIEQINFEIKNEIEKVKYK